MKEVIFVMVFSISLLAIFNMLFFAQCRSKAQIQNLEYNYGILQGCMIKHNNKWIDYEKYITVKD